MLARRIENGHDDIPGWCRRALTLDVIERLGAHGCFWLLFCDTDGVVVHASGSMPGSSRSLSEIVGMGLGDLPSTPAGDERREVFRKILSSPGRDVLVIDVWHGLEVWWFCGVECDGEDHCGVLAIGFRPSEEQQIPGETIVHRLRHVSDPGLLRGLSIGELEVLRLLAMGLSREQMAHEVHRTVKAVERRRTMLGRKLGMENSHMLSLIGLRAGLHRLNEQELEDFWRVNCGGPHRNAPPR